MKNSAISRFIVFLLFASCVLAESRIYANPADTIKPIPKINKEFQIVAHFVLDADSNNAMSREDLQEVLDQVNVLFEPIGASFTVCETRNIYNYSYLTIDDSTRTELMNKNHIHDRINMYFVEEIIYDFPVCGNANLAGVADEYNHNGIAIKYSCIELTTIAHELGHYFGLKHTFEGSGAELVDGSNCKIEGDNICDTPSDPFFEGGPVDQFVNEDCVFINMQKDANGEYYDPDVSNIMGYYSHCRCMEFTRGQYEYMANYYLRKPFLW